VLVNDPGADRPSHTYRFSPARGEDIKFAGNFLVFGHGPHYCVGKEYAMNHLITFLAIYSTALDCKRTKTSESHLVKYMPTIYPADSLFEVNLRPGYKTDGAAAKATSKKAA
jgi:sterol 22-desaturase